ncbi:MAG: hypothetical protein P9L99_19790 [Candidatus Lernaella stagnicola]|nr:hypothetical protein [Candidatus Lernaella stagnicola]
MNLEFLKKFLSRKLGTAGAAIAILAAIPTPDPITNGIRIAAIAAVAIGYMVSNAIKKPAPTPSASYYDEDMYDA